jgi:hypothetical protein
MVNLDKEEKELLDSYERGEWKSVVDLESEIERYREYARATIEKIKRAFKNRAWRIRWEDLRD